MDDEAGRGEIERDIVRSVLYQPEAVDVAGDYLELGVDSLARVISGSDALDAIPVVKSLRAAFRGFVGVREALLTGKLLRFIVGVGEATPEDVQRWRLRIDEDAADVGERLLLLIDQVNAPEKARLMGHVFRLYLDGECDRRSFLRTAEMIERALTEDLTYLIDGEAEADRIAGREPPPIARLVSTGLMDNLADHIVTETSEPASASIEGELLQRASKNAKA